MSFPEELDGFRRVQRLAYEAASHVESTLVPGLTEREVAEMLRERLVAEGVQHWFHVPFAWFGARTALAHDGSLESFAPSDLRLVPGMPVILDVAPIVDGYVADIGYSFSFGPNERMARMLDDLHVYRRDIVEQLRGGGTRQAVYRYVDARIREHGYVNRHRVYPMEVLGHRVARLAPRDADKTVDGAFGESATKMFRSLSKQSETDPSMSPFWNGHAVAGVETPPAPGFWAVEPHIADEIGGAKFEEILVVTHDAVFWLDDDLPHVRRHLRSAESRPAAAPASPL